MKRLSDDPAVRLAECRGEPAFDEFAERAKAYEVWDGSGDWVDFRDGWLACARQKAEERK